MLRCFSLLKAKLLINIFRFLFSDFQKLEREARICRKLQHPNIGKFSFSLVQGKCIRIHVKHKIWFFNAFDSSETKVYSVCRAEIFAFLCSYLGCHGTLLS